MTPGVRADYTIGTLEYPGFSALDIYMTAGSPTGVYWIDPDLPGGNNAVLAFGDMDFLGGGWTLALSGTGMYPDHDLSYDIFAPLMGNGLDRPYATMRIKNAEIDAYFLGDYGEAFDLGTWTFTTGGNHLLPNYGLPSSGVISWTQFDFFVLVSGNFDVFVRENHSVHYPPPDPVPLPGVVWLLGSLLAGFAGFRKKFNL